MSDVDDMEYGAQNTADSDPFDEAAGSTEVRRGRLEDEEEEEEEEEEGNAAAMDEDEEDEDEDEDPGVARGHKRRRHNANRFLDIEAEVDDDEDLDEEEEDYETNEFIAEGHEGEDEDINRRAANHARLDRRDRELDEQDLAQIAQDLKKRHGRTAVRYTGDMNEVPQRLLMPSVHDANLWQVRVKTGRERDIVFSLMRKAIDLEYTARPLSILSAFQRDSLQGMIYVEARSSQQVSQALQGLVGVYPSRGIALVPIDEMASLLQIKKQDLTVTPGSWVRMRRGKYAGDLAKVMDITENGEDVGLKFIPRIDLNPNDDAGALTVNGKRKKAGAGSSATMRPPQRFFNYEEVIKVYGRKQVSKRNQVYVFQTDTYKDGFIEKDAKLTSLILDNVNPTLDEITRFARGMDGAENENNVDLSVIAEASRKAAISVLQPGDHVEVFEGEQSGVHGVVQTINQDIVTLSAVGVDIDGQRVDVPARSVRKRFKPGDHVKVMAGQNADETGLVVAVTDNVVTFLSDMSMQEVSVFSKDLREAAEVGSGTNIVGNYELHDLVQLDLQTVGVIFKTERDSFRVLDQNGQVRLVQPHQISMRRDSDRAIATDSEGHELRPDDNVKEIDGEGRKGRVVHIHQSFFAFLHNRDIVENGGIFVTRARSLASLAPKGNLARPAASDLSKMNPAAVGGASAGGMVGSGKMGRGPRDRLIGVTVVVVKGPHKGYVGIIKDTNGPLARVELHTGNKVISIEKDKLKRRNPNGSTEPLEGGGFGGGFGNSSMGPPRSFGASRTPNPYAQPGNRTPGWGATGRTPNPYAADGGKTPAWNVSSRTPNPYDSGKTPAWNASSRTPNPYADGGRTPAWNAAARTPNPYSSGGGAGNFGGATPRHDSFGGATPKPASSNNDWGGGGDNAWGSGDNSWGASDSWGNSAPTPAATAETPGLRGAPTPAYGGFNNPSAGYTPAASSRQPARVMQAPTPGAGMYSSAPTPGATRDEDAFELPTRWLLDLPNYEGVVVKIQGTNVTRWYDGDLENEEGSVDSVLDSGKQDQSTATIKFLSPALEAKGPTTVQIKYLVPVPPDRTKDRCLVIYGERRGEKVTVYGDPKADGPIEVGGEDHQIFMYPVHLLAKLHI
ncbi:hypothetical protein PLICRDRAFT_130771 [Plicaturopsis crispa FD-325 SS-3]|nr:hypothetical protein PLICRDRAFT_130771 [Plicaturopsis crispa FD-325 SS-3]